VETGTFRKLREKEKYIGLVYGPNPKFLVIQPNHYTKQAVPDPGTKKRSDFTQIVTVLAVKVALMVGCLCSLFDDAFIIFMVLVNN
jgi:hypothetical protein